LDKKVQQHPGIAESDFKLTITAFDKNKSWSGDASTWTSRKVFVCSFRWNMATRNPQGHEFSVTDDPNISSHFSSFHCFSQAWRVRLCV